MIKITVSLGNRSGSLDLRNRLGRAFIFAGRCCCLKAIFAFLELVVPGLAAQLVCFLLAAILLEFASHPVANRFDCAPDAARYGG
jgi:hypothetical protein